MPLDITEAQARSAALLRIQQQDGRVEGVQTFLRGLGAHSEQAKRLTEEALADYDAVLGTLRDAPAPDVQALVEVDGKELAITLKADRLPITSYQELVDFYEIDTDIWHPRSQLFNFWGSEANPNFQVKATFAKDEYQAAKAEDREAFRQWAAQYAPEWRGVSAEPTRGTQLVEVVLSDIHAERFVTDGVTLDEYLGQVFLAFQRALRNALWSVEDLGPIHIVLLGDTFNADSAAGTTTRGTPQENISDYRNVFTRVRQIVASMVMVAAAEKVPVVLHIIPGNHDRERAYYLADSLWAYFCNHPNVSVELPTGSRQYIRWGSSLIGLAHGDDIKPSDLVMSMFREQSFDGVQFPVWHLGHFHTRREEEIHGVLLRYFRTTQGQSSWEEAKGFGHNQRDVVAILHSKTDGDVAEFRAPIGGEE